MAKVDGIVYLITNLLNDKRYVGQTTQSLEKRMNEYTHGKQYIDRAIRKYGRKNFTAEIIEMCPVEQLNERERFWIAKLNCKTPNGYNLTDGGEGIVGLKKTPEHCAKIGSANKGKKRTPEQCAKISTAHKDKPLSNEHRAKIGASLRDVPKTVKHRANIGLAQRGHSPFKNLLKELDAHCLTYASLAKLLGLAAQNVSRKMLGQRNFTVRDKTKLVEIFGKPVKYLMFKEDF